MEEYPDIARQAKVKSRNSIIDFLFDIRRWYLILILNLLIFAALIAFCYPIAGLKDDIGGLIDQRSGNLSTITGFGLAVIAFLMTNIAVKEPYAYKVVLSKTKFYIVLVCVITTLSCFILISSFRHLSHNEKLYSAFSMASGIIFVTLLALIGTLFFSALRYTSASNIDKSVNDALLCNAKGIIHQGLLQTISVTKFRELMAAHKLMLYNFEENFNVMDYNMQNLSIEEVHKMKADKRYIIDINIKRLNKLIIKEKLTGHYFHDRFLGMEINSKEWYILPSNNEKPKKKILKSNNFLLTTKNSFQIMPVKELREHYDVRIIDYAQNGKDRELKSLLEALGHLYALQMTFQHQREFELTDGLTEIISEAIKISLRKKNLVAFKNLISFTASNCYKAIEMLDLNIFENMLRHYPIIFDFVRARTNDKDFTDFVPYALDPGGFYELFLYRIAEQKKHDPTHIEKINKFAYQAYNAYGYLLYYMLSVKDYDRLIKGVKILGKQLGNEVSYNYRSAYRKAIEKPSAERDALEINSTRKKLQQDQAIGSYKRHTLFGLRAWVLHLVRHEKIEIERVLSLLEELKVDRFEAEDTLQDILFFRNGLMITYFSWQSWVFPDYFDSDEVNISSPSEWLTFGFLCDQIRSPSLPLFSIDILQEKAVNLSFLIKALKEDKKVLVEQFESWKVILKTNAKEELEAKADGIIAYFERLEGNVKDEELEEVAVAVLNPDAIKIFGEQVSEKWKEQAPIISHMESLGIIQESRNEVLPFIGVKQTIKDIKTFFVHYSDPFNIRILNHIGAEAGRMAEERFFSETIACLEQNEGGSMLKLILAGIAEIKNRSILPDFIFVEAVELYSNEDVVHHQNFIQNTSNQPCTATNLVGWFDKVPVYTTYASAIRGIAMVGNFKKAFQADFICNQEWPQHILQINVSAISEEQAHEILRLEGNASPSTSELASTQNSVAVKVGIQGRFKLADVNAIFASKVV